MQTIVYIQLQNINIINLSIWLDKINNSDAQTTQNINLTYVFYTLWTAKVYIMYTYT